MGSGAGKLTEEMLKATKDKEDADTAMKDLGKAIADFITNNIEMKFNWFAVNPTGAPDPTTTATGGILGTIIDLTPAGEGVPDPFTIMASQIKAGVLGAQFKINDPTITTPPMPMAPTPGIQTLTLSLNNEEKREDAFTSLGNQLWDWMTTLIPPTPLAGVNSQGVFTGTPGGIATGIAFKEQ